MEVASAARAVDREALSRGVIPADIAIARAPKRKNPTEADSKGTTTGLKSNRKEWAVKEILQCKPNPEGVNMYLVWWEGLRKPTGRNKDFWEPAESFANCPEVLHSFEAKQTKL